MDVGRLFHRGSASAPPLCSNGKLPRFLPLPVSPMSPSTHGNGHGRAHGPFRGVGRNNKGIRKYFKPLSAVALLATVLIGGWALFFSNSGGPRRIPLPDWEEDSLLIAKPWFEREAEGGSGGGGRNMLLKDSDTYLAGMEDEALPTFLTVEQFNELASKNVKFVDDNEETVPKFFFFATKGYKEKEGTLRDQLFLDSIFVHHPQARVFFIATTPHKPSPALFQAYKEWGYFLHGVHVKPEDLSKTGWWFDSQQEDWLSRHSQEPEAQFFFTHLSDYLRYFVLHKFGGIYTDSDSLCLQSFPSFPFAGLDVDTSPGAENPPPWFIVRKPAQYAAPGVVSLEKGSLIARRAMSAFGEGYDPHSFNSVGPAAFGKEVKEAIQKAKFPLVHSSAHKPLQKDKDQDGKVVSDEKEEEEGPPIHLLQPDLLYPVGFAKAHLLFEKKGVDGPANFLDHLRRISLAVHLFGGMTNARVIEAGSVVARIAALQRLGTVAKSSAVAASSRATTSTATATGKNRSASASHLPSPYVPARVASKSKCVLGGPSMLVLRGRFGDQTAAFKNVNRVFLRDCPLLHGLGERKPHADGSASGVVLQASVEKGTLFFKGFSESQQRAIRSWELHSLGDANRLLDSLVYAYPPEGDDEEGREALQRRADDDEGDDGPKDGWQEKHPGIDRLRVEILDKATAAVLFSQDKPMAMFSRLVTVMTHTNGRRNDVAALFKSLQRWFPGTPMLATDDRPSDASLAVDRPTQDKSAGPLLTWLPVPADCGLSLARNTMVKAAKTPFVYLVDDDFELSSHSHLDVLLANLLLDDRYTIAGAVIPADKDKFVRHFRGIIRISDDGRDLQLRPGDYGRLQSGCLAVDFVPNVFMGRRSALLRNTWDEELPLAEHEDFFFRAKEEGLKVMSCDHVEISHHQTEWWVPSSKGDKAYKKRRARVFELFKKALKKHGLKRLDSFGVIQAVVDEE